MVSLLLIAKENKFLLVKRSDMEQNYSGYWGIPGGGIEENETPMDAVMRETMEEIGLEITNMRFLKKYKHTRKYMHVFVFNSPDFDPNEIVLNEEHTEWGMFTYYEILQMKNVIPTITGFINDYMNNPEF